jgi:hypothetical protein
MREAKWAEEQAHGLYSLDGWDLPLNLEELCTRVTAVEEERLTEAGKLVVETTNTHVDLGMHPIRRFPRSRRRLRRS